MQCCKIRLSALILCLLVTPVRAQQHRKWVGSSNWGFDVNSCHIIHLSSNIQNQLKLSKNRTIISTRTKNPWDYITLKFLQNNVTYSQEDFKGINL